MVCVAGCMSGTARLGCRSVLHSASVLFGHFLRGIRAPLLRSNEISMNDLHDHTLSWLLLIVEGEIFLAVATCERTSRVSTHNDRFIQVVRCKSVSSASVEPSSSSSCHTTMALSSHRPCPIEHHIVMLSSAISAAKPLPRPQSDFVFSANDPRDGLRCPLRCRSKIREGFRRRLLWARLRNKGSPPLPCRRASKSQWVPREKVHARAPMSSCFPVCTGVTSSSSTTTTAPFYCCWCETA